MKSARSAIGFLTILPVGNHCTEDELRRAPGYFPLAGALEGVLFLAITVPSVRYFGASVTAGLLVAAHFLFTGGLHADGLSDTFDAIAVRSGREKKLSIMKDGTAGPIGVAALVSTVLMKYAFLNAALAGPAAYAAVLAMPVASKWAMSAAIYRARPARAEGLGHFMITGMSAMDLARANFLLAAFLLIPALVFNAFGAFPAAAGVLFFAVFFRYVLTRNFGGLTGDGLGALAELSDIIFLAVFIPCSRYF